MFEYLMLPVFRRAILALVLSGVALPSMGTYILSLELVPARFAVMHASLLGAAIGLAFGFDPTVAALAAALACGIAVWLMSRSPSGDSAGGPLALVMTLCVALAFIIFHKSGVRAMDAFGLFWGNILALRESDIRLTAAFSAGVLGFSLVFFKEIRAVLFSRELARSSGMPAGFIHAALIVLVCLGVGMAMRLTGALLADALTILPALAARRLGKSLKGTLIWGGCFGLAMNACGFALALAFDLPAGPAIILAGVALIGAASLVPRPH
jgi:zinc transport system permease protein